MAKKQMPAMLSVDKGEVCYKTMVSQWLRDEQGPILWKMLSKKRVDGKIELVLFTQRATGAKYIIQHISFSEEEFPKVMECIRDMIYSFFPRADLSIEDMATPSISAHGQVENVDKQKMSVYSKSRFGLWLAKINALKNGLLARFWTRVKK